MGRQIEGVFGIRRCVKGNERANANGGNGMINLDFNEWNQIFFFEEGRCVRGKMEFFLHILVTDS